MSAARYKTLLSHLPGMAAVVNAFQSPEVQLEVYTTLIQALDNRTAEMATEGEGQEKASKKEAPAAGGTKAKAKSNGSSSKNDESDAELAELEHEILEGASIHTDV